MSHQLLGHPKTPLDVSQINLMRGTLQSVPRILKMCELCLQDSERVVGGGVGAGSPPEQLSFWPTLQVEFL